MNTMPKKQRGAVIVMVAVGMLAIVAMSGLAIDASRAHLNKTRLHNALDASALGAAKILDQPGGTPVDATAMARQIFQANLDEASNQELSGLGLDVTSLRVEFSDTLQPFVPGGASPRFVRVSLNDPMTMDTWFMRVMGTTEVQIATSGVAGPSPVLGTMCDIAPVMVCGDPDPDVDNFGYDLYQEVVLTMSTGTYQGDGSPVGSGNFQLIRLDGSAGGADIRRNLAGAFDQCTRTQGTMETEPGNTVGPVVQGINTRFGVYQGGQVSREQYPPDKVTREGISYAGHYENGVYVEGYKDLYTSRGFDDADGVAERRILRVPVGNCTGTVNGQGTVPVVGLACFFLIEKATQQGNNAAEIIGEMLGKCSAEGQAGPDPFNTVGPTKIQLYGDTDRWDS